MEKSETERAMALASYRDSWATKHVLIELRIQGKELVLERTRGSRGKKKHIVLSIERLRYLVEAVLAALKQQPDGQLSHQLFVGMVDTVEQGSLLIEWAPYFFNTCNALMIRGKTGQCISVEQQDVLGFALWLTRQLLVLHERGEIDMAK